MDVRPDLPAIPKRGLVGEVCLRLKYVLVFNNSIKMDKLSFFVDIFLQTFTGYKQKSSLACCATIPRIGRCDVYAMAGRIVTQKYWPGPRSLRFLKGAGAVDRHFLPHEPRLTSALMSMASSSVDILGS